MCGFLAISTPSPDHLPWLSWAGSHCTTLMTGSCRHQNRREAPSCCTRICSCPTAWQKKKKIPAPSVKQEGWCKIQMTHLGCTKIFKVSFFPVDCFPVNTRGRVSSRFTCGYWKTAGSCDLLRIVRNFRTCPKWKKWCQTATLLQMLLEGTKNVHLLQGITLPECLAQHLY